MRSLSRSIAAALSVTAFACAPGADSQREIAELRAAAAEKDSLLLVVAENTRLMSDISAELARVQAPAADAAAAEAPIAATRENILAGIQNLSARLADAENRLAESQRRIDALSTDNTSLQGSISTLNRTVDDLRSTIENQKQTIAALSSQVEQLREENTRLTTENVALAQQSAELADTLAELDRRANTVYYIAGSKDDLIQRGIITEEGGSRVLFIFGKRGKTLVPARDLDPAAFTAIDMRSVNEIPLPWADRPYRIVSRQDLSALETPPDENGFFRGVIRIADPDRFWANARHLIIVEG